MTALVALATATNAQDLILNQVDEFTGEAKKKTKYYQVGAEGGHKLYASIIRVDDVVALDLWSDVNQGCGGAVGNYVYFKYDAATALKLGDDIADIDCAERASSLFLIESSQVKGVTAIRLRQSEGYWDFNVSGDYSLEDLYNAVQ